MESSQDQPSPESKLSSKPMIEKPSGNSLLLFVGVIIIFLLLVAIGLLFFFLKNNQAANNTVTNTVQDNTPVLTTVAITSPSSNDIVTGKINVSGTFSGLITGFNITISDDDNNVLDSNSITVQSSGTTQAQNWNAVLDLIYAPQTDGGTITVTPSDIQLTDIKATVKVTFKQLKDAADNRIRVFAPLEDQVMGSTVLLRGQMKGFFEGTMSVRLKDAEGNVIYSGSINPTPNEDNPDQYTNFVDFSQNVTIDNLAEAQGKTGTWEFYDVSMKDGSETVLLSINVRF